MDKKKRGPLASETAVFWGRMLFLGLTLLASAVIVNAMAFVGLAATGKTLFWMVAFIAFGLAMMGVMWRSMIQWARKRLAASLPRKSRNRLILFMAAYHALLIGTIVDMWADYRQAIVEERLVKEHGARRCPICREFALKELHRKRDELVLKLYEPRESFFRCGRCLMVFRSSQGQMSVLPEEYTSDSIEERSE